MKEDKLIEVEVGRLKEHPQNARQGDVNAIMQSIERHGQVTPLVVQRSTGFVVKGNHTLRALIRLGRPTAKILVKDMTDEDALAYLLADNATSDKGTYDKKALYDVLVNAVGSLEGTGYNEDDVDLLVAALNTGGVADDIGDEADPQYREQDARNLRTELSETAKTRGEPLRDIVLMMPVSQAQLFGEQLGILQKRYGTRTVVETVQRAVTSAVEGDGTDVRGGDGTDGD